MKKYVCKYAGFCCGIGVEEGWEYVFQRFMNEYSFYYEFEECLNMEECDARIYIVRKAYEGAIESEEVCIHSSHSKNRKYLLNGEVYTQENASVYANIKKENDLLYYYIKKVDVKVLAKLKEKSVYISGDNLYDMFSYVYETLLSINIEHNGGIQFHGACCTWNNKGYLITGKSGGGKTTLMFNILEKGGCFHSNDRVAIFKENDNYVAYSIPIPVNVPINMMRTLDKWKNTELVRTAEDNTKVRFLVKELSRMFGSKMIKKANVEDILVVNYSIDKPTYKCLSDKEIKDYVEVLSPHDENHPKWLPLFDYPSEEVVGRGLEMMKEKIKIRGLYGNDIFKALEESMSGDIIWKKES